VTRLKTIQTDAQRIAEAISSALGLETEIVDRELTIIAGTGIYRTLVGRKEESGDVQAGYIYGRVLNSGRPEIVEDAPTDPLYDPSVLDGTTRELAEICWPIPAQGRVIGVIGLVAVTRTQRKRLLGRKKEYLEFIHRMAGLLASKAREAEIMHRTRLVSNQLRTIIETIDEGILAIDRRGRITHCNARGAEIIGKSQAEIIDRPVNTIWPGSPITEVLSSGKGYAWREEAYHLPDHELHIMSSVKPIRIEGRVAGAVASFRSFADARRQAYQMMAPDREVRICDILGSSAAVRDLRQKARHLAGERATLLITGETGTGKGILAAAIHYANPAPAGPFITVNCGAIPDNLLESELFGYTEGAFSGARKGGKPGKFELADGGTIFLDEIGDLPLRLQSKLLHVLQTRIVERLGGVKPIRINTRVIASTNRDLEQMIAEGEFRRDLYYRLNVIPLHLPPLRERREDIPLLLEGFLHQYDSAEPHPAKSISREVEDLFSIYDWPGNIRELKNTVAYMTHMGMEESVTLKNLPSRMRRFREPSQQSARTLKGYLHDFERQLLKRKLAEFGPTTEGKQQMARSLGISRATLYRKLKQLAVKS